MSASDSRNAPRHTPLFTAVFLAWEGEEDYHFARGRLRELSSEGAGIAIYGAPPAAGSVWIGLEGTSMRDWVRADIVRAQQGELGAWQVGLRFSMACPIAFFRRAIWGESPMGANASGDTPAPRAPISRTSWATRTTRAVEVIRAAERPPVVVAIAGSHAGTSG